MFEKHCLICGMDVRKETATKRFGKYFCTEEHANQYVQKRETEEKARKEYEKTHPRRGGCC